MSKNFCCVTWAELGKELQESKLAEVDCLIDGKGLPKSVFSSVIRTVYEMLNYCPVCGTSSNEKTQAEDVTSHRPTKKDTPVAVRKPPKRCPKCGGKKTLGMSSVNGNSIPINCMHCHGDGVVDERHIVLDDNGEDGLPESTVTLGKD